MLRSIFMTSFFGMLRCLISTFDHRYHLSFSDIRFNSASQVFTIRIKASKTDPFRLGATIRLGRSSCTDICPVATLSRYIDIHRSVTTDP